jgi:predicted transcriptional regulator
VRVTSEPHMGVSVYVISAEEGGPDAARRMTSKAERKKNGGHVRAVSRSPAYRGIMNALMDAKGPMPRKAVVQATGLEEMQVDYSLKYLRTCGLIERKNSRYSLSEEGRAVAKKACNIAPPRQRVRAAVLVAERTTGAIADRADVDRNTARRALLEMVDEGTVEMRMESVGKRQRMWWKLKEASE